MSWLQEGAGAESRVCGTQKYLFWGGGGAVGGGVPAGQGRYLLPGGSIPALVPGQPARLWVVGGGGWVGGYGGINQAGPV